MTGEGVVVPPEEAAEVERRFSAFRNELQPSGSLGLTLVRRAATLAVRMEKCAERDLAVTAERVAQAMAEFEAPEGVDPAEATRLRAEAGRIAAFDPSKDASLHRRYEAAAERGFYRALKELRAIEKQAQTNEPAVEAQAFQNALGSFFEMKKQDEKSKPVSPQLDLPSLNNQFDPMMTSPLGRAGARVDVPITIGKAR